VRIIDIDEASLQRLGQWPWPRTQVAEMVQRLHAAEVAAIGFDVLFIEPDRTSPQALAPLWPLAPQTRQALLQLPDHDAVLAQHLADRHVVLGFALQRERAARANERPPWPRASSGSVAGRSRRRCTALIRPWWRWTSWNDRPPATGP
jgi:adenylate cyclase